MDLQKLRAKFDAMTDLTCEHRSRWVWGPSVAAWMKVAAASDCDCTEPPAKGSPEWIKWRDGSIAPAVALLDPPAPTPRRRK